MDGVMQIIIERKRRRRWSVQDKLRIVGELAEPGARVCDVAARHGVCESLVFIWRRQLCDGVLVEPQAATFLPVRMLEALPLMSDLIPPVPPVPPSGAGSAAAWPDRDRAGWPPPSAGGQQRKSGGAAQCAGGAKA